MSVLRDASLSASAVRVYALLAANVFHGRTVAIGHRLIARLLGMGRSTVQDSIASLAQRGHLDIAKQRIGARPVYSLTSNIFGQKQGAIDVIRETSTGRRLVSVRTA